MHQLFNGTLRPPGEAGIDPEEDKCVCLQVPASSLIV